MRLFILALTLPFLIGAVSAQTKRLSEDEAWELMRQAMYAHYDQKDSDRAIRLLQRVIASYPEGFRATSPKNLDEFIRKGDLKGLERAYKEVGDERFDLEAHGFLATIYHQKKKDYKKAAYHAEMSLRIYPERNRYTLEECRKILLQRGETVPILIVVNGLAVKSSPSSLSRSNEPEAMLVSLQEATAAAGLEVKFDARTGIAFSDEGKITVKARSLEAVVNGKTVKLSTAPQVVEGHLMVPLDFLTEYLGAKTRWYAATKVVDVILPTISPTGLCPFMPRSRGNPVRIPPLHATIAPSQLAHQTR